MLDKKLIENVKESLGLLAQEGEAQSGQINDKVDQKVRFDETRSFIEIEGVIVPVSEGFSRLMTEPTTFLRHNIEAFWYLFSSIAEDIESPLSNFALRPALELALSRVIHFASLPVPEQKEIAVMFWLCTNALLVDSHELSAQGLNRREAYESGLEFLVEEKNRREFARIRDAGYPFHEVHKKLHRLVSQLLDPKVAEEVSQIAVELMGGEGGYKWEIAKIYRSLSLYEHGNPVILRNLKVERSDKSHVTRCAKALFVVGKIVVAFTDKHFKLDVPDRKDLSDKIKATEEQLLEEWKLRARKRRDG